MGLVGTRSPGPEAIAVEAARSRRARGARVEERSIRPQRVERYLAGELPGEDNSTPRLWVFCIGSCLRT
jgi:hypothetical protein